VKLTEAWGAGAVFAASWAPDAGERFGEDALTHGPHGRGQRPCWRAHAR
jgi:hypothetical protein